MNVAHQRIRQSHPRRLAFGLLLVWLLSACAPALSPGAPPAEDNNPGAETQQAEPEAVPDVVQDLQEGPARGCLDAACHASMVTDLGPEVHSPFAEGSCDSCHRGMQDDHAERASAHQSSLEDIEVCKPCHPSAELGTSHPVDQGLIDPRTGGLLTCTSTCHDPHSAPYPFLLRFPRGGALCLTCHRESLP